jgi:hypothetical protein
MVRLDLGVDKCLNIRLIRAGKRLVSVDSERLLPVRPAKL